jgi:hypothetical protein
MCNHTHAAHFRCGPGDNGTCLTDRELEAMKKFSEEYRKNPKALVALLKRRSKGKSDDRV